MNAQVLVLSPQQTKRKKECAHIATGMIPNYRSPGEGGVKIIDTQKYHLKNTVWKQYEFTETK